MGRRYDTKMQAKLKKITTRLDVMMTQVIMVLTNIYCKLWHFFRCVLRNKRDFDFFIQDLRRQYPKGEIGDAAIGKLPFFKKVILVDDDCERSSSVKIGHCHLKYSFDKTVREQKVLLFDDSPRWEIARALLRMTMQQNHNASVLKFSKHRKENDGSNINRKSSS